MPKLTRYERLSTTLAIVALVLAIASPVASYFWFDPQFQAFRNRARLQVTMTRDGGGAGADFSNPNYTVITQTGARDLTILNTGELPAKDVLVSVQYLELPAADSLPSFLPPFPVESTTKDYVQFITLKKAIAPHETVMLKFSASPRVVWVSNEYGETSTILTGAKAFKVDDKTNTMEELEAIPPQPSPSASEKMSKN